MWYKSCTLNVLDRTGQSCLCDSDWLPGPQLQGIHLHKSDATQIITLTHNTPSRQFFVTPCNLKTGLFIAGPPFCMFHVLHILRISLLCGVSLQSHLLHDPHRLVCNHVYITW